MVERSRRDELEAAQQTIKFFETLLRASNDGIVITDAAQRIVVVNEAFCAFLGQRRQDVIETSLFVWLQGLGADAPGRWAELEQRVRLGEACRDVEFQVTTKAGMHHFFVNAAPLEQATDEETGVVMSTWRDVTEQVQTGDALRKARDELERRVEERTAELEKTNQELRIEIAECLQAESHRDAVLRALRESEARYRAVVEDQTEMVSRYKPDNTLTFVNDAFCALVGKQREELIGQSWEMLVSEENRKSAQEHIAALNKKRPVASIEQREIRPDGTIRWSKWTHRAIFDERGQLVEYQGVGRDITERKRAEETLTHRANQLSLLNSIGGRVAAVLELGSVLDKAVQLVQEGFGHHHVALFTLDRERGELLLRASAGDFTVQLSPDGRIELGQGIVGWVGRHGKKLLSNDVNADPRYASLYPDGAPTRSELSVPLRAGEEVVGVLDIQSPRLNAFDENDVIVIETLADQIAAAVQNARLYEAERAARERLRDLTGYLETAREEERTHIAREIHDEFGQALTALKMDLAWLIKRLPADKPHLLEKARVMSDLTDSIVHMVRRIATDLRPGVLDHLGLDAAVEWQAQDFAERTGVDCELHLGDQDIVLDPDLATAIFRIFQETLTNIARHAEASEVHVELKERPNELTLVVRDNGKGITQSQAFGSKSLGIIGMQERARSWGGDVTFRAVPGQGTTVTVQIPRVEERKT